jgi:glutathione S-transferase
MFMKIFGNSMSTCTRRVTMTLHEKQAKFDFVTLDFMKGEHKGPENLARQPFGQMPSMTDGDFTLFESRAMMRYIDATVPGQSLTPKDPKTHALMEQWMSVELCQFDPGVSTIVSQEMFTPMMGGSPNAAKIEEAKKKIESVLPVIDKHLSHGPHFCGDQFSLADIVYMPYTEYAMNTSAKDLLLSHKHFAAWWKSVSARPAWKAATAK